MLSKKNMPYTLIATGLILNAIDIATGSAGTGGRLYGPNGILRGVNAALPQITVPGTKGVTSVYPEGIPVGIGGWLVIAGVVWLILRRF